MTTSLMTRVFGLRREDVGPALVSALLFFLILCGYYILRPIREEMGLAGGVRNLPQLYLINLAVMLALAPVFGAVATRWSRRVFVPAVYLFFMTNMLAFFVLMRVMPDKGGIALGRVFYVWVSVYNMWAVSLFWAFMADGFGLQRSKRLFGVIAVGGSLGAVLGSFITTQLVSVIGVPYLILVSAVLMAAAAWLIGYLGQGLGWAAAGDDEGPAGARQRGHFWSGFSELIRSPYLSAVAGYILLFTITSTFLYFQQAEIVSQAAIERAARTRIFGQMDLATNILTFGTQIFLTGRLIRGWGVGRVLMFLPVLTVLGFAALGAWPTLTVLVVFQVLRRASNYALSRPARETLYTIVSRDQKYKVKSFIDTFVYRGGDAIGSLGFKALGPVFGVSGLAFATVPIALLWAFFGFYLGKKQNEMGGAAGRPAPQRRDHDPDTP
jgi:AAA family ATP:ADP antiporter